MLPDRRPRHASWIVVLLGLGGAILLFRRPPSNDGPRTTGGSTSPADPAGIARARAAEAFRSGGIDGHVTVAAGGNALAPGRVVVAVDGPVKRAIEASNEGTFSIRPLPPGHYVVSASNGDGLAGHAEADVQANTATDVAIRLEGLRDGVTLKGIVRDIFGGTLAGADVWITSPTVTIVARTDPRGEFVVQVERGAQHVAAHVAGYAGELDWLTISADLTIDLVVHPAASIRGRVVRADGSPAADARIVARGMSPTFTTNADADGQFTLDALPPGVFSVQASTGIEAGGLEGVRVSPTQTRDVQIALEKGETASGVVRSSTGKALEGATVLVWVENAELAEVKTDRAGKFVVSGVRAGPIELRVCAPEHACVEDTPLASAGRSLDVILTPAPPLRVHVVDEAGVPVRGARVHTASYLSCTTKDDGACAIEHVRGTRTELRAQHATAGYAKLLVDTGRNVVHELRLAKGATVRGTVRWDDGAPAVGVHVVSDGSMTRTEAGGRYELRNVGPGILNVRVTEAIDLGAGRQERAWIESIENPWEAPKVTPGAVIEKVDRVLARKKKTIAGMVIAIGGEPIPHVGIGYSRETTHSDSRDKRAGAYEFEAPTTYSGADGTFRIEDIADGHYTLWARTEHHPVGRRSNIAAGTEKVVLELPTGATLEGHVVDDRGANVTGFVLADRRFSGADGRFKLEGLTAKEHHFVIEGYRTSAGPTSLTGTLDVTLAEGARQNVNIVLRPATTVTGRLVSWPDLTPRANIELELANRTAVTDRNGRFRFERLVPGTAAIRARDADGAMERWTRPIPERTGDVDVGDLAFASGKHGYGPFEIDGKHAFVTLDDRRLGLAKGDEIVSVDGHAVATLSANSLEGVLAASPQGTAIVVRRNDRQAKDTATETVTAPAPRQPAHSAADDDDDNGP